VIVVNTERTPVADSPAHETSQAANGADEASLDGREQRSRRTRSAIVEAWLDLVETGLISPTARETADKAGIGLRTIFQHFGDMEDLHSTAALLHFERIQPFVQPLDPAGSFDDRLSRFVAHRHRLFERITPIRRAALHRATLGANVVGFVRGADESFAQLAFNLFETELNQIDIVESASIRHALTAAWSWASWDFLRNSSGLSPAGAEDVFAVAGRRLLTVR
jgi:TetR/AcrR family transcriptional regulator, regulator of autoinduction and epiphytic fitness